MKFASFAQNYYRKEHDTVINLLEKCSIVVEILLVIIGH